MYRKIRSLALLGALVGTGLVACEEADLLEPGDSRVRVLLTDAPSDYIEAAWVDIGQVVLLGGQNEPQIVLTDDGTDGLVNLLELQDAATETLAEADIEAGVYHQLRLIVESARVELIEGYEFNDGTTEKDLKVPSGAQTGIKLNLTAADGEADGAGVEFTPGEMVLVLDFDVNRSFVIQGNPETPAGINGVLFKPTLRVAVNDVAGSISGTVSATVEGSTAEGLTVTAERQESDEEEEFQTATATAVTDANGNYTLHFLVPGTYVVSVEPPENFAVDPASVTVTVDEDEDEIDVDFDIVGMDAT